MVLLRKKNLLLEWGGRVGQLHCFDFFLPSFFPLSSPNAPSFFLSFLFIKWFFFQKKIFCSSGGGVAHSIVLIPFLMSPTSPSFFLSFLFTKWFFFFEKKFFCLSGGEESVNSIIMLGCSGGVFFSQPQQDESFIIELFFFDLFIITKKFELDFRGELCSTFSSSSWFAQFNQPANYLGSLSSLEMAMMLS